MTNHLLDAEIADYLDCVLDPDSEARIEEHYLVCIHCLSRIEQIQKGPLGLVVLMPPITAPQPVGAWRRHGTSALAAAAMVAGIVIGLHVWYQSRVAESLQSAALTHAVVVKLPSAPVATETATSIGVPAPHRRLLRSESILHYRWIGPRKLFEPPMRMAMPEMAVLDAPDLDIEYNVEAPMSTDTDLPAPPSFRPKRSRNVFMRVFNALATPFRSLKMDRAVAPGA